MIHINKTETNIATYPFLRTALIGQLFCYKLCKYDAIGGIDSENDDVVFSSIGSMIEYGINAYLNKFGYPSVMYNGFNRISLLKTVLENEILYDRITRVIYTNSYNKSDTIYLYNETVDIVENHLFNQDVWQYIGRDGLFNWDNWISMQIQLKKVALHIGWDNIHIAPIKTLSQLEQQSKLMKKIFN